MFKRYIIIKYSESNALLEDVILSFDDKFRTNIRKDGLLLLEDENIINESTCDFDEIRSLVLQDFQIDLKIIVLPYMNKSYFSLTELIDYVNHMKYGVYYIEDVIQKVVIDKEIDIIKILKTFYINILGQEMLKNVIAFFECNLNSSVCAKELHMHRNTMIYQLDKTKEKIGIDPRSFKGANALYMLFVLS